MIENLHDDKHLSDRENDDRDTRKSIKCVDREAVARIMFSIKPLINY